MDALPPEIQRLELRKDSLKNPKHALPRMRPPERPAFPDKAAHELEITAPWDTQILGPSGEVVPIRDLPEHSDKWTDFDGLINIPPWMQSTNQQTEEKP